ncbi:NACHT domain-containing protein [Nonomuraea aurantiaca]|uniref:NACHT domain-containing protein n=1 Tax=Nonomuraea aurantiaca TaxID=2878562 RepID=UPI001CD96826|nr:NACHT domain-containing protein [Nonomuraea aurantiaca]MCA2230340.1 NACHT domain-containing protein [Nonomuraea aurantiaca]
MVRAGAALAVLGVVLLAIYFTTVGLEKADKLASVFGVFIGLAGLVLSVIGLLVDRGGPSTASDGRPLQPREVMAGQNIYVLGPFFGLLLAVGVLAGVWLILDGRLLRNPAQVLLGAALYCGLLAAILVVTGLGRELWRSAIPLWRAQLDALVHRYARRYRACVVDAHARVKIADAASSAQEEVQVDIGVRPAQAGRADAVFVAPTDEFPVEEASTALLARLAVRGPVRLLVTGAHGSGKSTALARVVLDLEGGRSRRLPLVLEVDEECAARIRAGKAVGLDEVLHRSAPSSTSPPPGWFDVRLRSGKGLLVADGLEHCCESVRQWFGEQVRRYPQVSCLITEASAERAADLPGAFTSFQMSALTAAQVETLVTNWAEAVSPGASPFSAAFIAQLRREPGLWACAGNPGALHEMFTAAWKHWRERRREIAPGQVWDRLAGRLLSDHPDPEGVLDTLASVMATSLREHRDSLDVPADLGETLAHSGLAEWRYENGEASLVLAHSALGDYLAARHLQRTGVSEADLRDLAADPWWRHPLLLYGEANAERVERVCADEGDPRARSLGLSLARRRTGDRHVSVDPAAELLTRLDTVTSIDGRRQVLDHVLTCADYDLFVAEAPDAYLDHWATRRMSEEHAGRPATGVRSGDLARLCSWLTGYAGGRFRYRLPRDEELHHLSVPDELPLIWYMTDGRPAVHVSREPSTERLLRAQLERDVFQELSQCVAQRVDAELWSDSTTAVGVPVWRVDPRVRQRLNVDLPEQPLAAIAIELARPYLEERADAARVDRLLGSAAGRICGLVVGFPPNIALRDVGTETAVKIAELSRELRSSREGPRMTRLRRLALVVLAATQAGLDRERRLEGRGGGSVALDWPAVVGLRWCARLTALVLAVEAAALSEAEAGQASSGVDTSLEDLAGLCGWLYATLALLEARHNPGPADAGAAVLLIRESEPDRGGAR